MSSSPTSTQRRAKTRRLLSQGPQPSALRGDCIVQQVKSTNGKSWRKKLSLCHLGLLQIGRSRTFYGGDAHIQGMIDQVQELVAVSPLVERDADLERSEDPVVLEPPRLYKVSGRVARHYSFEFESFLSIEPYHPRVAINWSTALPLATLVERIGDDRLAAIEEVSIETEAGQEFEVSPGELGLILQRPDPELLFVRLECPDLILTWDQPSYPTHTDEYVMPGRLGLLVDDVKSGQLAQWLKNTGTPPIGRRSGQLAQAAEEVLDH